MEELCKHVEWSLLSAASSFSSFAGLAASLVLASMVIILVEYKGDENPAAAVALFTVALLALGLDTFIFGAASGEVLCARGGAQGLLGGSTMATGVAILLLGITLLQATFKDSHAGLTLLGNLVTCLGAAGTLTLLALWVVRFVNILASLGLRPNTVMSYTPALVLVGVFVAVATVIAVIAPGGQVRRIAVILTMCVYLLHILATFVMYVATIVMPTAQWTVRTDSTVLTLTIAVTIAFPLIELTGVVMSLDWRSGREFWRRRLPRVAGVAGEQVR